MKATRPLTAIATTIVTSCILGLSAMAHAKQPELKPFFADYKAEVSGISGSGSRSLEKDRQQWVLKFGAEVSIVIASINIDETSKLTLKDGKVQPVQYVYKRSGIGGKPAKTANFNWKKLESVWQQKDETSTVKFKQGSQDPLSYQLQLRLDLKAGKKTDLAYPVVDDDEVYERKFIIEGEEILSTRTGKLKTIKVKIVRDDDDRQTWIWFAKDWDYILVQFLQKENDSDYLIKFDQGKVDGKPVKGL
ncbi:hypothetical protein EOPP23_20550 [Endozoicomonas sp. OPT23]|uniref:DUF3108 domain-containing protein n=1 Tax=Endozoicomonas sp. OPT23 TaxID=2072845 RepID=UPI00129B5A52|nr:DUF3108 domain-containing protein [Endozoicomonas sp. OPT23]MRI35353.1 hypothetical protein [Endozoicomonas sp. OPT23]